MTIGDMYATFGAGVDVLVRGPQGREGRRGDGRDRRLLAAARGRLTREIPACPDCQLAQRTATRSHPAVIGPEWRGQGEGRRIEGGVELAVLGTLRGPLARWERHIPTEPEVTAWVPVELCRRHRMAALDATGVDCVLLLGEGAVHAWRPDLGRECEGRIGVWAGRWWVLPVFQPGDVGDAIRGFGRLARGEWPAGHAIFSGRCVRCEAHVWTFDETGMAWCQRHS